MIIDVLIALAVVVAVGLIFGILLVVFTHFFGIEEDKLTKEIRAALPGINCGACGYKGCNDYAEAIAKGEAKPNLCIPGAEGVSLAIGEILGVEVEETKDFIAFVHCNGTCEAAASKAIYDGMASCYAHNMYFGGPKACSYGCLGCGDCAAVCPAHAICMQDGIAHVDSRACMGCGACVSVCPKHLVTLVPRAAKTVVMCSNTEKGAVVRKNCRNACIGCKKCELNCPEKAITVTNNLAAIDYDKCNGCGACVELCPMHCLKTADFSA